MPSLNEDPRIPNEFAGQIKPGLSARQLANRIYYLRRRADPQRVELMREKQRAADKRYNARQMATEAGRTKRLAKQKRYEATAKGKATQARYDAARDSGWVRGQISKQETHHG